MQSFVPNTYHELMTPRFTDGADPTTAEVTYNPCALGAFVYANQYMLD